LNTLERSILTLMGLSWTALGLWCAANPQLLAELAGLGMTHWSARVEVRAMYGGVQLALGVFTLLGAMRPATYGRPALLLNALTITLLALLRAVGLTAEGQGLQLPAGAGPQSWNAMALWFFELPLAIISWLLLLRPRRDAF